MGQIMAKTKFIWLILGLALLLRLVNINQSFWLDEATQAQLSSQSISQIWSNRSDDFHPPLFYFLTHFWLFFGTSEVWLRLLPISFGIATVWLVSKFDQKIGLISALLLAINPYHIYYSQEFRMYSLLAFLGTLSMYALYKKHWSLFIINTLLLYTHYSSILLIFAQVVYCLLHERKHSRFFIINYFLLTIFYLPWLPQFLKQFHAGVNIDTFLPGWRQILTVPTAKSLPLIFFKFIAGRINMMPRLVYGIYIIIVLAVTTITFFIAKSHRKFLLSWLFVPILSSIFLSFLVPQTQPFRLLFTLPALILIIAQACLRFPRLFLTMFIYISIVGNFLYFTRPRLQREQWRQAIAFLQSQDGLPVVKFSDKFSPFYWYAPNQNILAAVPSYPAKAEEVASRLAPIHSTKNIYLLEYLGDLTDPYHSVEDKLKQLGYTNTYTYNFEGVGFIQKYTKKL